MHPLAHILVGALIGQMAPHPGSAVLGGLVSHAVLDALPHTEGKTFRGRPEVTRPEVTRSRPALRIPPDLVEAGFEAAAGLAAVTWVVRVCPGAHALTVAAGVVGGLGPDLIDLPLLTFFGATVLHIPSLHWTVPRRHAAWGILTQVVVAAAAAVALWRVAGCGRT